MTLAAGKRKWFFRLGAALVLPALVCVAFEVGLRLAHYGYPTAFFLPLQIAGRACWVENDQFGQRFFGPVLARAPRPLAFAADKPPATVRVFVMGESAALGDPQPEFGLPRLLEVLLRERFPQNHVEVINAAMTAINSHVVLPIARECARHQSDFWVVYMGNNEVIGPHGPGTIFGPRQADLGIIRASLALKATRMGQLAEQLLRWRRPDRDTPSEWGGLWMFVNNQMHPTDPRLERVYSHFQRNLADILQAGRQQHVRLIVSTVASNLRDCPPFASRHQPGLSPTQLAEWDRLDQAGLEAQKTGQWGRACEWFGRAANLDRRFAELQFRWGQCCLELDQREAAHRHFVLARDDDALRFRADSRINDLIRKTAQGRETEGIYLVDAEAALGRLSPQGLTGQAFFYEHVHLNFAGNYWLARTLAEQVAKAWPTPAGQTAGAHDWPSLDECARQLAWAGWNRYEATAQILARLQDPPFTAQLDHAAHDQRLHSQLQQLRSALSPAALRQAVQDCQRACDRAPQDWVLDELLGRALARLEDWPAAADAWNQVEQRLPHYVEAHTQRGMLLTQARRYPEAIDEFESALALDPTLAPARDGIGRALAQQGRLEEAIRQYEQVLRLKPNYCDTLVNLGLALHALGRNEAAQQRFRQALAHPPNNPTILNALAKIACAQGWLSEGVRLFEAALRLDPADPTTELHLGIALGSLGRREEARQHYAQAVRLDPGSAEAHFRLGYESSRLGDVPAAFEQFTQALQLKPDFLEARLDLAIACYQLHRLAEAERHFQAVLSQAPTNAVARQYLQALHSRPPQRP